MAHAPVAEFDILPRSDSALPSSLGSMTRNPDNLIGLEIVHDLDLDLH
jgi:hypothetical protein